jgi:hypothetical protein
MKNFIRLFILLNILCLSGRSQNYWEPAIENKIMIKGTRQIIPVRYKTFALALRSIKEVLGNAPHEKGIGINDSRCIISIPVPDGSVQQFRVVYSPVMADELQKAYPDIRTYSIKGIDDPYANGKIDLNEFGFHGMVFSAKGDYFIDPYSSGDTENYIVYYTNDFIKDPASVIPEAGVIGEENQNKPANGSQGTGFRPSAAPAICVGSQLRVFDLAVACTGEYAKAATLLQSPTVAQALAKIVTSVNRVDGVYEKEVAVRMVLVPTETNVVFTDPATDPFTGNNNANTLINESQTVITNNIGSSNYDIGHTFSTGGGGLANLGCVCDNSNKAKGITGSPSPVGDPYDIDYVAHEIGHQFKASHTFNAITGSCNGNRSQNHSVEPGSGVTIMAYAGLCGSNNVLNNSIPYFHAISFDDIVNYAHTGTAANCSYTIASGNQPPVVTGSGNFNIPKSTPFKLTGSATDPDGDPLTYSWEETDNGASGGNWNSGKRPYFRSYTPTITPTRLFPPHSAAINGNFTGVVGEYLPPSAQTLSFRLTARDNKMGGGGVCYSINYLYVDSAGPFTVTYPSAPGISWYSGSQQLVQWDVNNTNIFPINCDSVRILISLNNGSTFSVLVNAAENIGSYMVTVPTVTNTINTCRIKIEPLNNIFYDVSNNNFVISIDPNVGLTQLSETNNLLISVWPNPFDQQLHIGASQLDADYSTEITITDILGKKIFERTVAHAPDLDLQVDMNEFSNGIYIVKVSNNGHSSFYKCVKE